MCTSCLNPDLNKPTLKDMSNSEGSINADCILNEIERIFVFFLRWGNRIRGFLVLVSLLFCTFEIFSKFLKMRSSGNSLMIHGLTSYYTEYVM